MKNVDLKFPNNKYVLLREFGSEFNLSFSHHLVLNNRVIALDRTKRILLVSDANNEANHPSIIELNKVIAVSIKKTYGSIAPGELRVKRFEEFLKRIDLQIEYRDKKKSSTLTFYDSETDELRDCPGLDGSARNWQMILSRLVSSRADKISNHRDRLLLA